MNDEDKIKYEKTLCLLRECAEKINDHYISIESLTVCIKAFEEQLNVLGDNNE